ncbi:hypothetical protein ACFVYP_40345 [Kitasatospora sp. NPDC058201]|uniref:hypothetical protein n=1 Tax=unclassified Kitasatospora TaxID=2633591 RepID=UPI00364817C2
MSRYILSLDPATRTQLEWGYDPPLDNVYVHLVVAHEFVDNCGLFSFIPTVGELMPALADMLTRHRVRQLTDEEAAEMTKQLIADGADPGDLA